MPYEGQPFQNAIFKKISEKNKNIETVGFVHSFPIGLPSNFIKRIGHPKTLIVNSFSQKYSFSKYLGWSKNNLKILPSSRFKKKLMRIWVIKFIYQLNLTILKILPIR